MKELLKPSSRIMPVIVLMTGALVFWEKGAELEAAGKMSDENQIHELMTGFQRFLREAVESIEQRGA